MANTANRMNPTTLDAPNKQNDSEIAGAVIGGNNDATLEIQEVKPLTLNEKLQMLPQIETLEDTLANYWDEKPAVYEIEVEENGLKTRKIKFAPAGSVNRREKAKRDIYREHFADINDREKQNSIDRQEAEIKGLNLTKELADEYRARHFVWEVPSPPSLKAIGDSRENARNDVQLQLPAGVIRG